MRRHPWFLGGLALVAGALPRLAAAGPGAAADPPVRSVTVTGAGVGTWPDYDPDRARFAIDTGPETDGRVTVTAGSDDPDATVTVDGRPAGNGAATLVEGLEPGDEVNVQVTDAAGSTNQSFVYLPAGFPRLRAETRDAGPTPGYVFLGLGSFLSEETYETVLDGAGVPARVTVKEAAHDLKPSGAGDGHYTVAHLQPGSTNEDAGYQFDEYDARFRYVRTRTLQPVKSLGIRRDDTDFHDLEILPDGRSVLVGYARDRRPNGKRWLDAVIQVQDRRGRATFTWSSRGVVKPREAYVLGARGWDYAHINSVQMQPNGDLVASFRNIGQVLRIATRTHGAFEPGDVVWRLGGERNEFTFVDDPYGGFCAQHDPRILPNGHLLLFDNGAERLDSGPLVPQTADMCPDPADPDGPRIARPQTRVAEYVLDPKARTATLVWSFEVPGRYSTFAGNARRLPGGTTVVGWWNAQNRVDPEQPAPLVSEVSPAGVELWSLTAQGWFSYRAHHGAFPDLVRPRVQVRSPAPGAVYAAGQAVAASYSCTDAGGSNLATCAGDTANGQPLDTTPGSHSLVVTTTDRAGNTRTRTVRYEVAAG